MPKALLFRPRLIQRLTPPHDPTTGRVSISEVFAFGGGYKNGGLSDEAMKLLSPHFSFDYMGAAEFEFGELPKSLGVLVKAVEKGEAVANILEINATPPLQKTSTDGVFIPKADVAAKPLKVKVYVIAASKDHLETIQTFLQCETITDKYGWPKSKDFQTKERTHIWESLVTKKDDNHTTIGGIDIENSWMWFAKRKTLDGMCKVFSLKAPTKG